MRRISSGVAIVGVLLVCSGCAGMRRLHGGEAGGSAAASPDAAALGHFLKGEVALSQNDVDTATAEFERAVAADPDTPLLRQRLANLYVRVGKLDRALQEIDRVLAVEPENVEALELRGGILSALGRDDEAVATYQHVLTLDPDRRRTSIWARSSRSAVTPRARSRS